ncbi:hypothetical protein [Kitasatospora sp. NPDC088346]
MAVPRDAKLGIAAPKAVEALSAALATALFTSVLLPMPWDGRPLPS